MGWQANMFRMQTLAVVLLVAGAFRAEAADDFPKKVSIGSGGALARCGPGDSYYATNWLSEGDTIEVWKREADGWLAIRPPNGSYSLVTAGAVRRHATSDVAEVVGEDVVAWIGSPLGHRGDYKWQVRLKDREKLKILGEKSLALHADQAAEELLKIAPPAGEFRWVHERETADATASRDAEPTEDERPIAVVDYQSNPAIPSAAAAEPPASDGFVVRKTPQLPATRPAQNPPDKGWAPVNRKNPTPGSFDEALRESELRLSLMAAQPAEQWDFASLREDAEALARRGTSTLERARAQRFLEQVEEFDSLKQRFAVLSPRGIEAAGAKAENRESDEIPVVDPRFDGSGWLLPVHSTQRTAPPYALLDSEGRILQFVSPAPGLNLYRYLRKEIGVYGERSFAASLTKPHLVAHRVVELDRHRR